MSVRTVATGVFVLLVVERTMASAQSAPILLVTISDRERSSTVQSPHHSSPETACLACVTTPGRR